MTSDPQVELGESMPRFVSHWIAASFGYLLMLLLPLIAQWPRIPDASWPQWWSLILATSLTSLVAAVVNANLPVTSRELFKSVALGFALNATIVALPI